MTRRVCMLLVLVGCARSTPATRYYQLVAPASVAAPDQTGSAILAVEAFETDGPYDDARIVYRESRYRLDYYHYHRWAAAPGALVADFLRDAYGRSGRFRRVVAEADADSTVVLTGRVIALEEIDRQDGRWQARVALELALRDAAGGELVWSERLEETEPIQQRSPEGVARALSTAMARIAARTAPAIARRAEVVAATSANRP